MCIFGLRKSVKRDYLNLFAACTKGEVFYLLLYSIALRTIHISSSLYSTHIVLFNIFDSTHFLMHTTLQFIWIDWAKAWIRPIFITSVALAWFIYTKIKSINKSKQQSDRMKELCHVTLALFILDFCSNIYKHCVTTIYINIIQYLFTQRSLLLFSLFVNMYGIVVMWVWCW